MLVNRGKAGANLARSRVVQIETSTLATEANDLLHNMVAGQRMRDIASAAPGPRDLTRIPRFYSNRQLDQMTLKL